MTAKASDAGSLEYLLRDQERMSKAPNYFAWQGRLVRPHAGGRVVEAGCGIGNFTAMLLDREAVIAVDPEPACIEAVHRRFPGHANLQTRVCGITDPSFAELARFEPDTCVCLNVLEHIEDDQRAVRDMAGILKPGGALVLLVPAFPSLRGAVDRNLGHHRRYAPAQIRQLAAAASLRIRAIHYVNSVGWFGWWANSHLLHVQAPLEWQVTAFDRFVAPVLSRLEAAVHPPFGQSLFAVLEK